MSITKELNNKHSDSNTIMFMGNKPLFSLIKWRERAKNLSLGVEKPFSSEPYLKASRFPTNFSLVLAEFGQSLDTTMMDLELQVVLNLRDEALRSQYSRSLSKLLLFPLKLKHNSLSNETECY